MQSIFFNYRGAAKSIDSDHVQGYGSMINGSSYEVVPTKEIQRASDKLRKQLGLSQEEVDNEETRLNTLNEDRGFSFKSENSNQIYTIFTRNQTSE